MNRVAARPEVDSPAGGFQVDRKSEYRRRAVRNERGCMAFADDLVG
jgi:hypothetical protein